MKIDRSLSGVIAYGAFVVFVVAVLTTAQPADARDWPTPQISSCYDRSTSSFTITVENPSGGGFIAYDIFSESGRQELGYFQQGQSQSFDQITLEKADPDLLRIWISTDGKAWVMNGATHTLNLQQAQLCPVWANR